MPSGFGPYRSGVMLLVEALARSVGEVFLVVFVGHT